MTEEQKERSRAAVRREYRRRKLDPEKWNKYAEEKRKYIREWYHRKMKDARFRAKRTKEVKGRDLARKLYPSRPCEQCGGLPVHRHHIDRNCLNNSPKNIMFLCEPCHKKEHMKIRRDT